MMRRLAKIIDYLELGRDEAQWLALFALLAVLVVVAAVVLGLAVRAFSCAGGITC